MRYFLIRKIKHISIFCVHTHTFTCMCIFCLSSIIIYLPTYPSTHLFNYLPSYPATHLPTYPLTHLSTYLPFYLPVYCCYFTSMVRICQCISTHVAKPHSSTSLSTSAKLSIWPVARYLLPLTVFPLLSLLYPINFLMNI